MARKKISIFNDEEQSTKSDDSQNGNSETNPALSENVERTEESEGSAAEKQADGIKDINDLLNQYSEEIPDFDLPERKKRGRKPKTESAPGEYNYVIPGKTFVVISDMVVCSAFGFIDRLTNKNPIDTTLMRLRDQQIADLEELGAAASKELFKGRNALEVFAISLCTIQLTNYITLRQFDELNRKKK